MDTPSRNASSPSSTAGSSASLGGSSSSLMASAPAPAHPHFLFAPPPLHQSCTDDEAAAPSTSTPPPPSASSASNRRIEWTRSNILSFIEDYRQQRNLWDSASTGYHVKQTKFEALKALSTKYSTDIRTIRSKIKSLRSSFHREHGKVKNCRQRGLHYQPMWFAYDAIRFILPPGEDVKPLMGGQACGGGGVGAVGALSSSPDAAGCLGDFKLKEEVMEPVEEGDEEELHDGFDDICLGKEDAGDRSALGEMADGNNNDKSMRTYEPSYSNGGAGTKGQRKTSKEAAPKKAATTASNTNSSGTDSTVSSTTTSPLPLVALKHELFGGSGGGASNNSTRLASLNGSSSSLMATVDALHEKAAAAAAAAALAEAESATSSPAAGAANSLSEVINYLALTRSRTNILAPILTCNNFSVYSNHHNNNSQHHSNNGQHHNNNGQHHNNNGQHHHNNGQHHHNNGQQHRNNNSSSNSINTNPFNNGCYTNDDANQNQHNNNNGGLDMSLANGGGGAGGGGHSSPAAANTTEQFVQRINAFVTAAAAASIVAANCQSNNNNNSQAASFFNGIGSSRPADSDGPRSPVEYHDPNQFQGVTEEIVETQLLEASDVSLNAADMSASMTGDSLGEPGNTATFEMPSTSAAAYRNAHGSRKRKLVKTEAALSQRALNGGGDDDDGGGAVTTRSLGLLNTINGSGGAGGSESLRSLSLVANTNAGLGRRGSDVSKMRRFVAPGNLNSTAAAESVDVGELLLPPPPFRYDSTAENSENDDCLIFGEYVGRVIRKLSMRADVKNVICNALYQAEKREEEMRQQMEREMKDTSGAGGGGQHPSVASTQSQ